MVRQAWFTRDRRLAVNSRALENKYWPVLNDFFEPLKSDFSGKLRICDLPELEI